MKAERSIEYMIVESEGGTEKRSNANLQSVSKDLVHLGDFRGDTEVDCSVSDLNEKTTNDIGVDLRFYDASVPYYATNVEMLSRRYSRIM